MGGFLGKIPMASKDGTKIKDFGGEWRTPTEGDKTRYPRLAGKLKIPQGENSSNAPAENNNTQQSESKPTGGTRLKKIKSATGLATKTLLGG